MNLLGRKFSASALKLDRKIGFPVVKKMLNGWFCNYGRICSIDLDSEAGRLEARVDLHGEDETIDVSLCYEVEHCQEGLFVALRGAESSKPWLEALLIDFAVNQKYEIPPEYSELLEAVI